MKEIEIFSRYLELRDLDLCGFCMSEAQIAEMRELREKIKQIFEEKQS